MPSNGTGVGNDVASERKMVRKFIVDSVLFWLKEYQVDGFRFDLMGILDTETMNEIRKAIDEIDPYDINDWRRMGFKHSIVHRNKGKYTESKKMPRIGQFNDEFRDSIKGSTFNLYDIGYALGNEHYYHNAMRVLAGSIGLGNEEEGLFNDPNQSVNYVESHDNHTLWDKLMVCLSGESMWNKQRYHCLATTLVILAQGFHFFIVDRSFFVQKRELEIVISLQMKLISLIGNKKVNMMFK